MNIQLRKNNFICLLFSFFLLFTLYYPLPNDVFALNVQRSTLSNGLILLHSENHSLPLVMVTLIVKAGQVNEPEEKAGLANLVAELITEGTKSRNANDINEELDFIGASLDASAENDYTIIKLSILKKDIEKGFEIFSDILLNPTFPQEEIDRKKERIKGYLIRLEEEPSFLAERAFRKELFGAHPYGRIVEGSIESINKITREDVVMFYSNYFIPNNSIISVAGDLTSDELNSLLERYLGNWEKKEMSEKSVEEIIEKKGSKIIKIGKDLTQANIIIGTTGIKRSDPKYYAFSIMNYIFGGGGFSSRLMQSIREEKGLAYDVHSFLNAFKNGGSFQIGLQTKNETANIAIDEIIRQVKMMRDEGISERELEEAKSYLIGSFKRRLDTNRKVADFLAFVEFFELGHDYAERYQDYIESVTREDVMGLIKEYLRPEDFVIVVVANLEKAKLKF